MTQTATRATLPVLRALLDQAQRKDYRSGVLGVRARPEWPGPAAFTHANVPVRVVPCVSALAVREALLERVPGQWLVVLTDRPEDDLGAGILSHLVWHRLRTPDPWDAVRQRFAATGVDPALTTVAGDREIAVGLLAAAPQAGWQPAPGGVLTRDHALGAVAAGHLGLTDSVVDGTSVLAWTADPAVPVRVADLRVLAGDALTGAVLAWVAGRVGAIREPLLHLLRAGEGRDAVPLGLVAGLLAAARDGTAGDAAWPTPETAQLAREALIRLEPRFGGTTPDPAALRSWSGEAATVASGLLGDPARTPSGEILLARADELLGSVRAAGLAEGSDLLPAGLTRRLAGLAESLRAALAGAGPATDAAAGADQPRIRGEVLGGIEQAWARVAQHQLAGTDERTRAFHAAVRLARWLAAGSAPTGTSLSALLGRHRDSDAWVDSAVNDAARGASDPGLGAGLAAVLTAVRDRRSAHDQAFAAALAAHTSDDPEAVSGLHAGVRHLEDLLPGVVLPLARRTPVLLLILDGMSAGVGVDVAASVLSRTAEGWAEALLPGERQRAAALAVLPTLTEVSRASLLSGGLRRGGQDIEQREYENLCRARGLPGAALFHKKPLDSSRLGYAVADDVAAAIADVAGRPLVTCVLNTIDDALDRSDPGGTDWGTDAVKHLAPLLDRARYAGRVVILTADHGHVVERREGTQRTCTAISSGRSRAAIEHATAGEVLVSGPRVRLHDGTAVLAVDERLRYGPLKAGYHGGAAPAEAVVPVAVFVPGAIPDGVDLHLAPPQEPAWWIDPVAPAAQAPPGAGMAAPVAPTVTSARYAAEPRGRHKDATPSLFDEPAAEDAPAGPNGTLAAPHLVPAGVLKSTVYAAQSKVAGRVSVTDDQVGQFLGALLAAPDHRLAPARAATVLAVPTVTLHGAVLHVQRLLNVEGYPVVRIDADGGTVILDEALLREQFGIRG